jgi:hypothetical protein
MFIGLLLLLRAGASWAPFVAIPAAAAGLALSLWLLLSGVAGLILASQRPLVRTRHARALVSFTNPSSFFKSRNRTAPRGSLVTLTGIDPLSSRPS